MSDFRKTIALCLLVLFAGPARASTELPTVEAAKLLLNQFGGFTATGAVAPAGNEVAAAGADIVGTVSAAVREYGDEQGLKFSVTAIATEKDSAAYALLTELAPKNEPIRTGDIGIASVASAERVLFCKGQNLIEVRGLSQSSREQLAAVARALAAHLPEGDDDIPVLVKHLPAGQSSAHAAYAVSLSGLKQISPNQPIADTVSFEGGTEAVSAAYGQSQLVIVEFSTPQFAGDNDRNILPRIQELKSRGQPVPTAYRRVGNYLVFVFNGPDEKAANELIDQVKYQQVVQWLGEDPHLYERLQKYFAQTSAGVLMAVLESSGLSLIGCLGLGALFGTLLFRYRRAQRATRYSDAGGAVRLNLDELTSNDNSRRLLSSQGPRESSSKRS